MHHTASIVHGVLRYGGVKVRVLGLRGIYLLPMSQTLIPSQCGTLETKRNSVVNGIRCVAPMGHRGHVHPLMNNSFMHKTIVLHLPSWCMYIAGISSCDNPVTTLLTSALSACELESMSHSPWPCFLKAFVMACRILFTTSAGNRQLIDNDE